MQKTSQISLPRAILFDHDGTLVSSEPFHWAAWEIVLKELDIPYVQADLQKMVGLPAPDIMTALLNEYKPGWSTRDFDVHALARKKNDYYLTSAQTGLRTYPGVRELIAWCRENGIKVAVVSNAKRRELEAALGWLEILPHFDVLISRDDAEAPKPHPSAYLIAAANLELYPSECLAVEDSPTGIESSLMAKVPSAAVLTNFNRAAMEQPVPGRPDLKPVWIGNSIQDLFDDLRSLVN